MADLLQLIGVGYLLAMLYLSFLYYKKNTYTLRNFLFWVLIWVVGVVLLLMPATTSILTQKLQVGSVIQFYLILGLMFFSVLCFLTYASMRRTEARVEELVRKIALERAPKRQSKR